MVRGIEKRNIINKKAGCEDFLRRMGELAKGTDTAIYAWAMMGKQATFFYSALSSVFRDSCANC